MAKIKIIDVNNVLIDGVLAGQVADVMVNHPTLRPELQRELSGWYRELVIDEVKNEGERRKLVQAELDALKVETEKKSNDAKADKDKLRQELSAENQKQRKELEDAAEAASKKTTEIMDALKKEKDAKINELTVKVQDLETMVNALGGTEAGKKMRREQEMQRLHQAKEEAEKRLKELETTDA